MATRKKKPRVEVPQRSADEVTEEDVNAAIRILTHDYYNDVRSAARYIVERLKEEGPDADVTQVFSEVIDGTQRIIYTFQAKWGLILSDNSDAYVEEFGDVPVEDGNIKWEAMAFMAMERDIQKELEIRGFDVHHPRSWADFDLSELG